MPGVLVLLALLNAACTGGTVGRPDLTVEDASADEALGSVAASPTPEPAHSPTTEPPTAPAEGDGSTGVTTSSGQLAVHYLDVGQGEATLLLHPDVTVLIDTGRHDASDVVPELRAHGVDALDLVVVTHPHADHLGQFDRVLSAFDVAEVWWSGSTHTTRTFERALDALESSDAAYEEPRAGDATWIGPLHVEVVNPPDGVDLSDLHDAGLALRVTFGSVRFLFTGDAESATEARMVRTAGEQLRADILQVGHHGSLTSTTPAFLQTVDPAVAIYSAGQANPYGHPHAEVLDRLTATGVEVYGTPVHGTVTVTTDGAGWQVTTQRPGSPVAGDAGRAAPPPPGVQPPPDTSSDQDGCAAGQVDINRAGVEQLQQIIHIGPERARQILDLRPFASVRDMTRINGIGPARLDDIIAQGVACAG